MEDFGRSVKFFPLVGVVLGTVYALAAYLLLQVFPEHGVHFPLHLGIAILLVLPILLTGGLHCDGFMDTMDGILSGRSRPRMLEIMKDSRVGATGVTSFILLLILQGAVLLDLYPTGTVAAALFIMPVIARMMMVVSIVFFPYARPEGMGKAFADFADRRSFLFALFITLLCVSFTGYQSFLCFTAAFMFTLLFSHSVADLLGGLTGDVYGAVTTLNEVLVLLVYLLSCI